MQVNGFRGVLFSSENLTHEKFADACRQLLDHGTAAFLPTIVTAHEEIYKRNFPLIADVIEDREFSGKVLGIHAEGPFISDKPGAVGAHPPEYVRKPSRAFFDKMQEWARGHIRLVTLAAETEGAEALTRHIVQQGGAVSLGHQMASGEDLARLADAGASSITHLGNGMPNKVDRHFNQLLAGLAEDRLSAMFIADGHHLPPHVIKIIVRCKSAAKALVTSDAFSVAGCKPGSYNVHGNHAILREDGLFYNPVKKCMVGSSFTLLECANWLIQQNLFSDEQIINLTCNNPLKLIGMPENALQAEASVKLDKQQNCFVVEK